MEGRSTRFGCINWVCARARRLAGLRHLPHAVLECAPPPHSPPPSHQVDHFLRFKTEERQLPVVWQQTLLCFVQRCAWQGPLVAGLLHARRRAVPAACKPGGWAAELSAWSRSQTCEACTRAPT